MTGPVLLAGGTGLLGRHLRAALEAAGVPVVVLSRGPGGVPWSRLPDLLPGARGIVNLAGENLGAGRWTPERRKLILLSRLETTARITASLGQLPQPPVLVQASAVGLYGPRGLEPVDEDTPAGSGFLAEVCRSWEAAAAATPGRCVMLRFGVVLARDGGALPRMALPVRCFAGVGLGPQGLSWIHVQDAVGLLRAAIEREEWNGPFNACAPHPVSQTDFTRALGAVLHRPIWPAPPNVVGGILRLALGEMAQEMVLQGAFVHPRRAHEHGFTFAFPRIEEALQDLCSGP